MFLDLSREEVGQYLEEVKQAVRNDRYRVSPRGKMKSCTLHIFSQRQNVKRYC